jgi:predicted TIM-barrel fold metal-dependent hydrolase
MLRSDVLLGLAALGVDTAVPVRASAQAANPAATRLDLHHHYCSPEWLAALTQHHKTYDFPGLDVISGWSAKAAIDAMDKAGVATSVLSTTTPGIWFGNAAETRRLARSMNDYGASLVRDHKSRYGLFGVLPLPDVQASLAEIPYVMDTLKADGIGVLSSYGNKWLGDPSFEPIWAELNHRKAVVFSHATAPDCCKVLVPHIEATTIELNTDTARTIIDLIETGAAERYPDIRFIFSHAGGTIAALAGRYLRKQLAPQTLASQVAPDSRLGHLRRFYYDTAGSANIVNLQALKMLVPVSQFVFGTDYPWAQPAEIVAGLNQSGLTPDEIRAINRDNALRLLPQFS